MDDDSVEKFFRQADPGRFDTNYSEDDWNRLNERLDKERARVAVLKRKRLTYAVIGGIALIIFSGTFYFVRQGTPLQGLAGDSIQSTHAPQNQNDAEHARRSVDTNKSSPDADQLTDSNRLPEPGSDDVESDNRNSTGSADQYKQSLNEKKSEINFSDQATTDKPSDVKTNMSKGSDDVAAETIISKNAMTGHDVSVEQKGNVVEPTSTGVPDERKTPDTKGTDTSNAAHDDSLNVRPDSSRADAEPVDGISDDRKKETTLVPNRWMISAVIAPDFSRTAYSGYDSPGDAYGLFVHYRFLKRWSVSTGILRSNKKYWGYGDEYNPPNGYWENVTNGVVPDKVDGNCVVLEVPLSLAYNVVETRRSRVFATVGISSYFMRSEAYEYTFDDPNPGSATGWSTDEPSSYWFGIGSLSVGYDYQVSPTLSFGFEPYYRIPFAEVGWANIDLYSLGLLFNARYRFIKKDP
jgi:hypothetical protein